MKLKAIVLSSIFLGPLAFSQSSINVSTGSEAGTYHAMYKNLGQVCTSESWLKERLSAGSLENIQRLLDNQVSAGFVQLDVLKAKRKVPALKDERVNTLKVLLPLYAEEVHILAKANSEIKKFSDLKSKKGTLGLGAKKYTVGAWGGSSITAQVLQAYTGVDYSFVEFKDQKSATDALLAGRIDAVIAVGGQPLPWLQALSGVKLVAFDLPNKVSEIYTPTQVSYAGLGSVNAVSIQSVLVVRDFKTAEKKKQLLNYKKCAISKLPELQETEGYHAKWGQVDYSKPFTGWELYK